jgi:hypothetical protein
MLEVYQIYHLATSPQTKEASTGGTRSMLGLAKCVRACFLLTSSQKFTVTRRLKAWTSKRVFRWVGSSSVKKDKQVPKCKRLPYLSDSQKKRS